MSNEVIETTKAVVKASKEIASNPDVQQKVVSMLDELQNGAVQVGGALVKYSPDVANAALWVVRIDGLQNIIGGMVCLGISLTSIHYIKKLWKNNEWMSESTYCSEPTGYGVIGAMLAVVIGITGGAAILTLANVWSWIAVFEPKLYLAKQIINHFVK